MRWLTVGGYVSIQSSCDEARYRGAGRCDVEMQDNLKRPAEAEKLSLHIVGRLRLLGPDAVDYAPRGRKARGLLALLAMAPRHERGRSWLQDKLWSDRDAEQGSSSLRQTLTEIRRALGPFRDCLRADRNMVSLARDRIVIVSTFGQLVDRDSGGRDDWTLFEGLDVVDKEFENWLRDQRARFEGTPAALPIETVEANRSQVASNGVPAEERRQLQLLLKTDSLPRESQDLLAANYLTDSFAKTISELSSVDIVDTRNESGAPGALQPPKSTIALSVSTGVSRIPDGAIWRTILSDVNANRVIWTSATTASGNASLDPAGPEFLRNSNQAVDAALAYLMSLRKSSEGAVATFLCNQAIQQLLRLGKDNLAAADTLFARAFELEPRGIYLAWRAYLRTFSLIERFASDRQATTEEATAFMHRAMEMEPLNSYVASFSAHVHAVVRRSYVAAYELAQRSIQLNRANPIGWTCLGIAECHLGKSQKGLETVLVGRELAGASPFRYQVDGLSCIAASMAGDVERAIWLGEASHALAPDYKPPLRYLSALYLVQGDHERSAEIVGKLQALEPNFSYDLFRDKSYPLAGLQRAKLLDRLPRREI